MTKLSIVLRCVVMPTLAACSISLKEERPKPRPIKVDVDYEIVRSPLTEKLNTFDEKYSWEKREQGTTTLGATTSLELSDGEQLLVLNKALVNQFFKLPDTLAWIAQAPPAATATAAPTPGSSVPLVINKPKVAPQPVPPAQFIRIKSEQLDKTIRWRGELSTIAQQDPNAQKVQAIYTYIDSILSAKAEVVEMRAKAR